MFACWRTVVYASHRKLRRYWHLNPFERFCEKYSVEKYQSQSIISITLGFVDDVQQFVVLEEFPQVIGK